MGRLLRISIYALGILLLYFWITSIISSYTAKSKNEDLPTVSTNTVSDSMDNENVDIDSSQINDNKSLENDNIDYNEIDKKVNELKQDNRVTSTDSKPEQIQSTTSKSAPKETSLPVKEPIKKSSSSEPKSPVNKGDGGAYMVICGSYLLKENADNMVQRLKKLGYSNAKVTIFNESGYHSAIAGQYSSHADAQSVTSVLKKQGIDCFVKSK